VWPACVKGGRRFTHLQNQTVLHILVTKLSHEGNILAASTSGLRRSRPPGNCLDLALSSPPLTKPIYWYVLERKHGALSAAKSRHLAWKHFRLPPFPCKRARYRSPASPTRPTAAYYLACSNATSSLLRASHLCLKTCCCVLPLHQVHWGHCLRHIFQYSQHRVPFGLLLVAPTLFQS